VVQRENEVKAQEKIKKKRQGWFNEMVFFLADNQQKKK
jgi:hypothetical protein